ncbi:MAG: CBS domain-containing protein [Chthoniobacteraceae bacterium]
MSNTPNTDEAASIALKALAAEKAGALNPQDSVETAGDRMREHNAAAWPVAEDRKLVGMIDEKDPDWKVGGRGHDPKTEKVGAVMNRDAIFCYEDEDCASAQKLMEERGLRYLPVVDRQMRVVGIFSREEIQEKTDSPSMGKSAAGNHSD